MSLWDDPVFKSAYNGLSMDDKVRYQKLGEQMYNDNVDYHDPKVTEYNYAHRIKTMLRDGLSVDDLTLDEKRIYLESFGMDALEEYMTPEKKKKKKKKRTARMVGGKRV